jgi:hypothetical protein
MPEVFSLFIRYDAIVIAGTEQDWQEPDWASPAAG